MIIRKTSRIYPDNLINCEDGTTIRAVDASILIEDGRGWEGATWNGDKESGKSSTEHRWQDISDLVAWVDPRKKEIGVYVRSRRGEYVVVPGDESALVAAIQGIPFRVVPKLP